MDDVKEFEKLDGGMTIIFYIKKIWLSISLFIKKNPACLLLLKKKKKTKYLGFLAYLLFYCTFCMSTSFFIKKIKNKKK